MKPAVKFLGFVGLLSVLLSGCESKTQTASALDPDLARFVAAERAEAKMLAKMQTNPVPAEVWKFFDAVQHNDWEAVTNHYDQLRARSGRYYSQPTTPARPGVWEVLRRLWRAFHSTPTALQSSMWSPLMETLGTFEQFQIFDGKWLHRFGNDIIQSIPTNSIYFGGTDPGRFVVSALSKSYSAGRPFFIITQNQLADATYLDYLLTLFGDRLSIPTTADLQRIYGDYTSDARRRMRLGQLKAGEDIRVVNGQVQVSGEVAVMEINGLLAKELVDKNPGHEVYVEESYPLDWMYSRLSPHGLIMKLSPEPLNRLSDDDLRRDRDYWHAYMREMLGDWLTEQTSVEDICKFTEKVYLQKNLDGFSGDAAFVKNDAAQKTFSKLRSSIAGVYAWRAENANSTVEKQQMTQEADFAFRQAFALCPYSPEAVYRYTNLLMNQNRKAEALMVAQTGFRINPEDHYLQNLVDELKKQQ